MTPRWCFSSVLLRGPSDDRSDGAGRAERGAEHRRGEWRGRDFAKVRDAADERGAGQPAGRTSSRLREFSETAWIAAVGQGRPVGTRDAETAAVSARTRSRIVEGWTSRIDGHDGSGRFCGSGETRVGGQRGDLCDPPSELAALASHAGPDAAIRARGRIWRGLLPEARSR